MNTVLTKYALCTLALVSAGSACAKESFIADLGRSAIPLNQPLNTPFVERSFSLPPFCTSDCGGVKVTWTPLARQITGNWQRDTYLFDSGLSGIAVSLKATSQGGPENASSFMVGLFRTSEASGAGELSLSHPVARWEVSKKNAQGIDEVTDSGMLTVKGNITAGSCAPSAGTLNLSLPPISVADLKHYAPGERVGSVNDTRSIKVICTPGYAGLVSVYFSGEAADGNRTILKTSNDSVGFIIKEGVGDSIIRWGDGIPLALHLPDTGQLDIPVSAYYTRLSDNIQAGKVSAVAQYTMQYK
ncbi:fimbrial protein [Citrobacter meridianamericanus]|uniref:fimbrial protein n=1 Tax=Citrobacter meridianamericanus TaxID=2894201 RepID=UPI00351D2F61